MCCYAYPARPVQPSYPTPTAASADVCHQCWLRFCFTVAITATSCLVAATRYYQQQKQCYWSDDTDGGGAAAADDENDRNDDAECSNDFARRHNSCWSGRSVRASAAQSMNRFWLQNTEVL